MIFRFKQFAVSHANSSMKVGTDAVILGSWAEVKNSQKILDIGTGSGIIALMMAQKNEEAKIKAIDIDENSIHEASQNFKQSPWSERLEAECIALQNYGLSHKNQFDHIISNPPFFSKGTPAPEKARHNARHTDTLSAHDFFKYSKLLLTETRKISLIVPFDSSADWIKTAEICTLFPSRITNVLSYPGKPVERLLIEFSSQKLTIQSNEFYIRKGKGLGYSEEYIELTEDFYL
jgi:tRNA1Val (adenine37-N6)-methyltransferase